MRILIIMIAAGIVSSCTAISHEKNVAAEPDIYEGVEFRMQKVIEPVFPDNTLSITDFGAAGDGVTLNTDAFSRAINELSSLGGGSLIIPEGIWLTGPVILKSNIRIHTEEGALIVFSPDKNLYPVIGTSFEGNNTYRCMSPIYGKDLVNIAFTGKGIFDGSGDAWRHVKKEKLTESQWNDLVRSGGVLSGDGRTWFPSESYKKGNEMSSMNVPGGLTEPGQFGEIRDFLRPVMVSLVNCSKILFDGPAFQNSPAWCIHPLMCEDLTVRNVTVRNPWYSQNGDGIDIESCRNTVVYGCSFDVGDDAICIKSGKDEDGRRRGMPCENIVIRNCVVYHGHGGVTIGSEMSGGVKNVSVSDCTFIGTDVGLRFKSNRGRGGVVENLWFSDIRMTNILTEAISINMYYGGLSVSEMLIESDRSEQTDNEIVPVTEETPCFRNISMKNIICRGARQAMSLQGLPELNLSDIVFENIGITAGIGIAMMDTRNVSMKNIKIFCQSKPVLAVMNSSGIKIDGLDVPDYSPDFAALRNSENIKIEYITPDGNRSILETD